MKRKAVLSKKISVWYGVIMVLIAIICIGTYYSYAMFTVEKIKGNAISIVTGELVYEISGSDITNQEISVKGNEIKILEVVIKSENKIESKYKLYYEETEEVEVNVIKGEGESEGQIETEEKRVTIVIRNQSNSTKTIKIGVQGGLVNNELVLEEGREALGEEERYSVGTRSVTGGSVSLSKSSGVEGQTISFTTTPNTNFTYQGATIRDSAGNVIKTLSSSTKSFTLTNEDVVVSPKWKRNDARLFEYGINSLGGWQAGKSEGGPMSASYSNTEYYIQFDIQSTANARADLWTYQPYVITDFSAIQLDAYEYFYSTTHSYYTLSLGVSTTQNLTSWVHALPRVVSGNAKGDHEFFSITLDVSDLQGSYYVGVQALSNSQSAGVTIHAIYFIGKMYE